MRKEKESEGFSVALERYLFDIRMQAISHLRSLQFVSKTECRHCGWRYDLFEMLRMPESPSGETLCSLCGRPGTPVIFVIGFLKEEKVSGPVGFSLLSSSQVLAQMKEKSGVSDVFLDAVSFGKVILEDDSLYFSSILRFGSVEAVLRELEIQNKYKDQAIKYGDSLIAELCEELPDETISCYIARHISYVEWVRRCHKIKVPTKTKIKEELIRIERERNKTIWRA